MSDLIDRQAAIDGILHLMPPNPNTDDGSAEQLNFSAWKCALTCAEASIKMMPSAQPQRIKGRWVRKESDLSWWYECSECGESPLFDPYENEVRTPFCPWCGAEMKGEEDG